MPGFEYFITSFTLMIAKFEYFLSLTTLMTIYCNTVLKKKTKTNIQALHCFQCLRQQLGDVLWINHAFAGLESTLFRPLLKPPRGKCSNKTDLAGPDHFQSPMRQQKGQNENRHRQKAMYIRQSHKTLIKQSSVPFGYETMGVASVTMAPNSDTASGKTKYCLSDRSFYFSF